MQILQNYSLKALNTFGIDVLAEQFVGIDTEEAMSQLLQEGKKPALVLGGGSNLLLTKMIEGLVLWNRIMGIEIVEEDETSSLIKVGAGEVWHNLVLWAVAQGWGGIENLALIPGTVGAAPIQNIGAYGVELTNIFEKLEAYELETGERHVFSKEACQFGYRNSIFKGSKKGKYLITYVYLRLSKKPEINTSYGAIQQTLENRGIKEPTVKDVCQVVIDIRTSKLPDPKVLGNSGSFFKNPTIDQDTFEKLMIQFPNLVYYALPDRRYKIPAGWMIDQCGWKGKRVGNTGCYEKQALVIVNYGGASGLEIFQHAKRVAASVKEKFGIELDMEVNVI